MRYESKTYILYHPHTPRVLDLGKEKPELRILKLSVSSIGPKQLCVRSGYFLVPIQRRKSFSISMQRAAAGSVVTNDNMVIHLGSSL